MTFRNTALLYGLFAIFAIALNLGAQAAVIGVLGNNFPYVLFIALTVGTGVALVAKYILDKTWIFKDFSNTLSNHARKFTGYTLTGAATTALFWITEIGFDAMTEDGRYRYLGGAIGLIVGYTVKFWLDSRFVFRTNRS